MHLYVFFTPTFRSVYARPFLVFQQISGKSQRIVTESAAEVLGVVLARADRTLGAASRIHCTSWPILAHPRPSCSFRPRAAAPPRWHVFEI